MLSTFENPTLKNLMIKGQGLFSVLNSLEDYKRACVDMFQSFRQMNCWIK